MDDMSIASVTAHGGTTPEVSVPVALITDIYVTSTDLRVWAWFAATIEASGDGHTAVPTTAPASALNISVPTVNRSVSSLDSMGWITRTRRMGFATLTEVHRVPLSKVELRARAADRKKAEKERARVQRANLESRRPVGRPRRA